jgi:transposase
MLNIGPSRDQDAGRAVTVGPGLAKQAYDIAKAKLYARGARDVRGLSGAVSHCGRAKPKRRGQPLRDDTNQSMPVSARTDFRDMAVRLVLTREVSRAQMARDLGVGVPTLTRWVRDAIDHSPFGDVLKSLHDEVGILQKENAALRRMLLTRNVRAAPGPVERQSAE